MRKEQKIKLCNSSSSRNLKGEHNLKALTLPLFVQRQDGMARLGLAVDRNTVLTPQHCLKSAQAGTTKKKKAFPGKLMLNVHRKKIEASQSQESITELESNFSIMITFSVIVYLYVPTY